MFYPYDDTRDEKKNLGMLGLKVWSNVYLCQEIKFINKIYY